MRFATQKLFVLLIPSVDASADYWIFQQHYLLFARETILIYFSFPILSEKEIHLISISTMSHHNITEALKAEDPMRWVGLMNNARNEVEWFITKELIFN